MAVRLHADTELATSVQDAIQSSRMLRVIQPDGADEALLHMLDAALAGWLYRQSDALTQRGDIPMAMAAESLAEQVGPPILGFVSSSIISPLAALKPPALREGHRCIEVAYQAVHGEPPETPLNELLQMAGIPSLTISGLVPGTKEELEAALNIAGGRYLVALVRQRRSKR